MNKELFGIGRGYLFGFSIMFMTGTMVVIAMLNDSGQTTFLLGYWADLAKWITPVVLGAKGLEKIGVTFGNAQMKKHEKGDK